MNIGNIKKLEKEVKKKTFEESYGGISKLSSFLSILGNFASIGAAYFFMSVLFSGLIENVIVVTSVTLIILVCIELIKRLIFDKFSLEFIRYKFDLLKPEVLILFVFSLGIIAVSFYSSLNGAQSFADRDSVIENELKEDVSIYEDSIRNTIYLPKIKIAEDNVANMRKEITEKDNELKLLNSKLSEGGYLTRSERARISDLKKDIEYNRGQLPIEENKVIELSKNMKEEIDLYKSTLTEDISGTKSDNKKNALIFVIFSTIVEFTILIGIFFTKYYKYRSFSDRKKRQDRDPKYQKWLLYNDVLEVIYMNEALVGDKLPTQKDIIEFCKMNEVYISRNELTDLFKLLNVLNIIKPRGAFKFIHKEKEEASEILAKYFKVI